MPATSAQPPSPAPITATVAPAIDRPPVDRDSTVRAARWSTGAARASSNAAAWQASVREAGDRLLGDRDGPEALRRGGIGNRPHAPLEALEGGAAVGVDDGVLDEEGAPGPLV